MRNDLTIEEEDGKLLRWAVLVHVPDRGMDHGWDVVAKFPSKQEAEDNRDLSEKIFGLKYKVQILG